jgi:hypothetical protein
VKIRTSYRPEACVHKDVEERFNLVDPYLDVAAKKVVATNGYSLVAVPVEVELGDSSCYISRDLFKIARRKVKLGPAEIEDKAEIVPTGITWPSEQGREFPEWKKVVPDWDERTPGTVTVGLNAKLLKGLSDALGGDGIVALTIKINERDTAPLLVRALGGSAGEIGLLMPCRAGEPAVPVIDLPEVDEEKDRRQLEIQTDEILGNAGDGALNDPKLKGEAVARKPRGGRRG